MKDYSNKAFWLATYGVYASNPPLQGDLKADIAMIGGGFTGHSTAFNLRKDDQGYLHLEDSLYERHIVREV